MPHFVLIVDSASQANSAAWCMFTVVARGRTWTSLLPVVSGIMADLAEGWQYGLCSENAANKNKSVLHVKLTDSALKALQEYQRIKVGNDFSSSMSA